MAKREHNGETTGQDRLRYWLMIMKPGERMFITEESVGLSRRTIRDRLNQFSVDGPEHYTTRTVDKTTVGVIRNR